MTHQLSSLLSLSLLGSLSLSLSLPFPLTPHHLFLHSPSLTLSLSPSSLSLSLLSLSLSPRLSLPSLLCLLFSWPYRSLRLVETQPMSHGIHHPQSNLNISRIVYLPLHANFSPQTTYRAVVAPANPGQRSLNFQKRHHSLNRSATIGTPTLISIRLSPETTGLHHVHFDVNPPPFPFPTKSMLDTFSPTQSLNPSRTGDTDRQLCPNHSLDQHTLHW